MNTTATTYDLEVSRFLPATPEEVFDAYTDAEQQKIWFQILDTEPSVVEIDVDLRVGGLQHAKWGPSADELYWEDQTFLEIDRPHRLATSSTGGTPDGDTMTTQVEVTFEAKDGGTLMTIRQSGLPSAEIRDFFRTTALQGAFDRIEAYLTRR